MPGLFTLSTTLRRTRAVLLRPIAWEKSVKKFRDTRKASGSKGEAIFRLLLTCTGPASPSTWDGTG